MARKKTEKYDLTERLILWAIRVCVILLIAAAAYLLPSPVWKTRLRHFPDL